MIKVTEGGEKEQRTCNASKACGIKIKTSIMEAVRTLLLRVCIVFYSVQLCI